MKNKKLHVLHGYVRYVQFGSGSRGLLYCKILGTLWERLLLTPSYGAL